MEIAKCSKEDIIYALQQNNVSKADIQSALAKKANTAATVTNTTATKAETSADEAWLLEQWLNIAGENADTAATTANTTAKGANLGITELLTVAQKKLNTAIKAHPLGAFTAVVVALSVAIYNLTDRVVNAEKYARKALDKSAEKVDNVKSELESLNSELQTTQSRIDELNAKENLTLVEREELDRLKEANDELDREIRLKQSILSKEQKDANKDAKKYFTTSKDSLEYDVDANGVATYRKTDIIGTVEERIDRLQQYADGEIKLSEQAIELYKDYIESTLADFMESDDYLVEGLDDGILDRLDALYEKFDIYTNGKASVTENKLKDILSKADFQSASKQLEELGKSGELSVTTLSSRFPELINYLDEAGISAEELYQYIMALSNPDALNYGEIEKQFKESVGIRDGEIGGASDQKTWNEIKNTFGDDNWELTLEAYLKVRDQYGEHPEGWTAKDWISNIQNELNATPIETEISIAPTISSSVEQLAAQLEPQFAKLGEAYQAIFQMDEETGKGIFSLDDVDNDMLEGLRQSFAEIEEEVGVAFDASVLNPFFDTLTNGSSTAEQVQQAFNDLATAYFYSTDTLGQLNEETAEAIAKQLEEMGVVNAQEVVYDALNAKTEALALQKQFLAATGIDLSNASSSVVTGFLNEAGASDIARAYLFQLITAEQVFNNQGLSTEGKVAQLKELATAYGQTAVAAKIARMEDEYTKSHQAINYAEIAKAAQAEINGAINNVKVDFKSTGGSKKSGSGSSKSSKDLHKEAYEKELKELEHLHEMGLISDAEYWQKRLDLNEKYFGESSGMHEKYLDEYRDNEEDILKGLKDLWKDYYDERKNNLKDLISYAEKLYDKEIDSYEKSIDKLEERRDAEKLVWEGQIDDIGDAIDALDKEIDAIDDEADALEKANKARQRALDLQQKQWALQKAMYQRTMLIYSESRGMHYVADPDSIRSAKNDLADAEHDNKIADLDSRKEDLKDQQKDLEKQQDALKDQLEIILASYETQIKSIEKQIDGLKQVKSAWSEIVENQELKELEARLKAIYGDDVREKILSGNTDFINSIISQYSSTSDMLRMIEDAALADIQNMVAQYGVLPENLMPTVNAVADISGTLGTIASNVGNALGTIDTSGFNANMDSTAQSSSNAADKVQSVTGALNALSSDISNYQMPELNADNFASAFAEDGSLLTAMRGFTERFREICDEIPYIWDASLSEAFGVGGGNGDPLAGGLSNDTKYSKLFTPLLTAIDDCKTGMEEKLAECLETFHTFNSDLSGVIGTGGDSKSSGKAKTGTKGSKGKGNGSKPGSGGSDTIVGTLQDGGTLIGETLNGGSESWSSSFMEADASIHSTAASIAECMESMAKSVVDACNKAIDAINRLKQAQGENNSGSRSANVSSHAGSSHGGGGKAYASGTKGLPHAEKNALISEYGQTEMTVLPDGGGTIITNTPTMMDLPKDTVIYNEEQTKKIMDNKVDAKVVKSYANGTVQYSDGTIVRPNGDVLRPLQTGDDGYALMKAFEPLVERIRNGEELISNAVFEGQRQMEKWTKEITNNTAINNIVNNRNVQQPVTMQFGDINLTGVQDVNGLAQAIKTRLPNAMLQEMHRR